MDSDRRHDLQHNALDSELSKLLTFFKTHGNRIFWAVIILGFGLVLLLFAHTRSQKRRQAEVARYEAILTPSPGMTRAEQVVFMDGVPIKLKEFAETANDRTLAAKAMIEAGNFELRRYLLDGAQEERLVSAESLFNQAKADFADRPIVVAQAQFGLGVVAENRSQLLVAREAYNAVLEMPVTEGTPIAEAAKQKIALLPDLAHPVRLEVTEINELPGNPFGDLDPGEIEWDSFDLDAPVAPELSGDIDFGLDE